MESFIHADIFFFVTTIAVIIVTVGIIIAAVYVIEILRNVRKISETINKESLLLANDLDEFRHKFNSRSPWIIALIRFIGRLWKRYA